VGTGEQRSAEWDLACLGHTTPWDREAGRDRGIRPRRGSTA